MRFARTAVTALVATSALGVAVASPTTAVDPPTELFISEYIEGSSNNKAIEIYNGTGASVDLSTYTITQHSNGNTDASANLALTGSLAPGEVFVYAHASADPAILAVADETTGAGLFNGDDAVVLRRDGSIVDAIGQIGFDPGSQWGTGDTSTQDNTLRRKASVCAGDPDASDVFDPSVEWDGFPNNTFDGLGSHTADCGGTTPDVTPVINEFSASTTGTDVEYIEIFAAPDTDLSALSVIEIEGDSASNEGVIDEVVTLGTTDSDGLFLAALPANALENGTITLLLVDGFSGALGVDLDTDDDGVADITPWSEIVDGVAVTDGGGSDLVYSTTVLGPDYDGLSSFAPGGASRVPDGLDSDAPSDWVRNDFDLFGITGFPGSPAIGEAINTPGAPNAVVTESDLPVAERPIWDVQGNGFVSPYVGERVVIDGFVVGDFQGGDSFNGFHVQEPVETTDHDASTSDGIFVYSNTPVDVGDFVTVTGTVVEFNGLTEISPVESVVVSESELEAPSPTSFTLPADDAAREAVEGMLVTLPQDLVISEYFNFDRFNEIVLTTTRQNQPTAVVEPGADAVALAAVQELHRITLDDGRSRQNMDPAIHPNGEPFTLDNLFRGGDLVTNTTGIMDFAFGSYKIQPTQGADYTPANPRPDVPDVGGDLTVASFNVLNYFNTIDDGQNDICGAGENLECRGADNETERVRQLNKIVAAMTVIQADVFGIIEVENTPDVEAMADIVDGLNAAFGAGTYDYVDTGVIGTDAIKVGFIYNTTTATTVGGHAILDESVDPRFDTDKNRPALAQTFSSIATGGEVTVSVNHLKSKGSDCNSLGDPDTGDGQGNCNLTRTAAAEALADWMASDPTGIDAPTLIVGDLNAYDLEDPIDALKAAGYTDLVAQFEGETAYSYVFDGKVGYLDHALADAELVEDVSGAAVWRINADEADLIDYDTSFKQDAQDAIYAPDPYRSSDHDPVIVGLDLCEAVAPSIDVELSTDLLWPPNHKMRTVSVTSIVATDNFDSDVDVQLVSVTSDEPDNGEDDGNTVDDVVIVDDETFELRAERSGEGDGRTYTVTYSATDDCGNWSLGTATVEVPLRKSGGGRFR